MRDTIFIGHANPEDDEFTLWLQCKLKNEGYKCECDISFLKGGESDYWKSLQEFLEDKTIKYILVVSKFTFTKNGVLDEWEHCKSIEKQNALKDFILPVKVDSTPFNSRIGLNRRNIIQFELNWAFGLKRLLTKLASDKVFKEQTNICSINSWYENTYTHWSGIKNDESDIFYSNWLNIPKIPEKVFFYRFNNEEQAKAILNLNKKFPLYRHGNVLITFQKSIDYFLPERNFEIPPEEKFNKNTDNAFMWYDSTIFPVYHDFKRLLVRLIRECFEKYLLERHLIKFQLSNSDCFYFKRNPDEKIKGSFQLNDKTKNISVTGKYYDSFWHYAISFKPLLYPNLCLSFKNHIIFTEDGNNSWKEEKQMHKARRDKGKNMRNKEWRNLYLSFLSLLSNPEDGAISVQVSEDEYIVMECNPITFKANFSYIEPNDQERLIPIDSFLDEEDYYMEETESTLDE